MHDVIRSPLSGSSIRKVLLLIRFLSCFKDAFTQSFLTSAGNLVTYTEFLGYGIKCNTSDPGSPKVGNEFFNSFTKYLKTLCKPMTNLFVETSDTFNSFCVCLMQ